MTSPSDPNHPRPNANVPSKVTRNAPTVTSVTGRTATVAEIGRELGDLDFEPDDLLASLRPLEPDASGSEEATTKYVPPLPSDSTLDSDPKRELDAPQDRTSAVTAESPTFDVSTDEIFVGAGVPTETVNAPEPMQSSVPSRVPLSTREAVLPPRPADSNLSARVPSQVSTPPRAPLVPRGSTPSRAPVPARVTAPPRVSHPPREPVPSRPSVPSRAPSRPSVPSRAPAPPREIGAQSPNENGVSTPLENEARKSVTFEPSERKGSFESAPYLHVPHSISPPSLGHSLERLDVGADAVTVGPDVVMAEELALLQELIALPEERLEALTFPLERPAVSHIDQLGLTETFRQLADILETESKTNRHPQERAELAIVASELLAMTGQKERAIETLTQTPSASIPFHAVQLRQLAFKFDDLTAYAKYVRADLRTSVTHEARRHLMALYVDVARAVHTEEAEQRRHLELSLRAFPTDPRFQLIRLVSQLSVPSQPGQRLRPPAASDCLGYAEIVRDLSQLRSNSIAEASPVHPLLSSLALNQALEQRNLAEVFSCLETLRNHDGLSIGATWLKVALGCHRIELYSEVETLLESLAERGDDEAELALLEHQLASPKRRLTNVEVFSSNVTRQLEPEDRLALSLAVSADHETLGLLVDKLDAKVESVSGLGPLAFGTRFGVLGQNLDQSIDRVKAAHLFLGRCLGTAQGPLNESRRSWEQNGLSLDTLLALSQCETNLTCAPLTSALRLWHATHGESLTSTATHLTALLQQWPDVEAPYIQVLAALLAERDDNCGQALALLRPCLELDHRLEVAVRAYSSLSPETPLAPLLEQLATTIPTEFRRGFLELELRQLASNGSRRSSSSVEAEEPLDTSISTLPPVLWPILAILSPDAITYRNFSRLSPNEDERSFTAAVGELLASRESVLNRPTAGLTLFDIALGDSTSSEDIHGSFTATRLLERALDCVGTPVTSTVQQNFEQLSKELESPLVGRIAKEVAEALGGDLERFEAALAEAKSANDSDKYLSLLLRAKWLDPERDPGVGSHRTALAITERFASDLSSLRTLLIFRATQGGLAKAYDVAERISVQLDRAERHAHAFLATVGHIHALAADDTAPSPDTSLTLMAQDEHPQTWAVRRLLTRARRDGNDERVIAYYSYLKQYEKSALDAATDALRTAEAALRIEHWDDAEASLAESVELFPDHLVALSMRAEFLEARGNSLAAADAFDALATASCMPAHRVGAWLHAAELYATDTTSELSNDKLTRCLEQALRIDPTQSQAQSRLMSIYSATSNYEALEALLTQRLLYAELPNERAILELNRAHVLLELGRTEEARNGLQRALSLNPDDEDTISQLSELLQIDGQYEEAEQQLLRLASTTTNDERSVDAYRRLAVLYETALEHPTRAETAYREILRRRPADSAGDALVQLYLRQGTPKVAVELLLKLVEHSKDGPLERDRTLELARIYDAELEERRRAEEVLEKARRRWTNDSAVLTAMAGFYLRGKDHSALTALLDRGIGDARRALGSGRFDANFFEIIATVGKLRDNADLAQVASATLTSIAGKQVNLTGLGLGALNAQYSDLLAPETLSLPLRALLLRTGAALCAVAPIDLRSLRAVPLSRTQADLAQRIAELGACFGLGEIHTYVSPALGAVCQPVEQRPPTLVMGNSFVAIDDPQIKDALLIRALRILSANAAALANSSPVDLWPLLGAHLATLLPDFTPVGVEPKRLNQLRSLIQGALPPSLDRDIPMLAADVAATIGNRASQLGLMVQEWGSRTALLALGDPTIVFLAIATAYGQLDKFTGSNEERLKWLVRNPEARDIAVFSVTDNYLECRATPNTLKTP